MKIVINCCYGGFGLSDTALEMILNRKGIEWEKKLPIHEWGFSFYTRKDNPEESLEAHNLFTWDKRNDPILIEVVEALGEDAWGSYSELKVVEIPDEVDWEIVDYDGMEHVAERHRIWR